MIIDGLKFTRTDAIAARKSNGSDVYCQNGNQISDVCMVFVKKSLIEHNDPDFYTSEELNETPIIPLVAHSLTNMAHGVTKIRKVRIGSKVRVNRDAKNHTMRPVTYFAQTETYVAKRETYLAQNGVVYKRTSEWLATKEEFEMHKEGMNFDIKPSISLGDA